MIEFICAIIIIFVLIKLISNKFKIPHTKTYTFEINESEINSFSKKDKVNIWTKPNTTEIRFYCTSAKARNNELIGSLYSKNIHNYINQNPKKSTASITYVNKQIVKITLELI